MNTPAACIDCGRPFRPCESKVAQYPGTIEKYSRTKCRMCHRRNGPGEPFIPERKPPIRECVDCGQLTRPKSMGVPEALKLDPRPTITRVGNYCYRCTEVRSQITAARVAYVARELEAYMRWRGRDISALGLAS